MTTKNKKVTEFREQIIHAMVEIGEPATIHEIGKYLSRELGREIHDYTVRDSMRALAATGYVISRVETDEERELRFNGKKVFAANATLYYPSFYGDVVPPRMVASIAPGIEIKGHTKAWGRPAGSRNKKRTAARGATRKVTGMTGALDKDALDFLVEKLVEARTKKLQHELNEARAQLAEIRKLLS